MTDPHVFEINEQATGTYTATLVANDGVTPIPAASLLTLTLSLYVILDDGTEFTVNGRSAQNVLNANDVTINASGALVWSIQVGDTTLVQDFLPFELHHALFEWTSLNGDDGNHELHLRVRNLRQVP